MPAFLASLAMASWPAASRADLDEAWVQRAPIPSDLHPLLAVILDRSAAASRPIAAGDDYDPARDYGTNLAEGLRCDPARVYFRRGPGPAPNCATQAGVDFEPRSSAGGLQCDSARDSLASAGFFVASRAAQWRASPEGGFWTAPQPENAGALECRADRGRHGASPGAWFAADGTGTAWTDSAEREVSWDRPPFADAYIFYVGNFLNFLRARSTAGERVLADVMTERMSRALAATTDLDVALVRVDDDGPEGGYVARAPVPTGMAATELIATAAVPPAGSAPLAETLTETASWLAGRAIRFGTDSRADPAAVNAGAAAYRSPFEHACRPVSVAYLTAGEAGDDDQAGAAASSLPGFDAATGGCAGDCLGRLTAWLDEADLRDDLPGAQSAPVAWISPVPELSAMNAATPGDPLAYVNAVAGAFQRDAARAADPQLSTAALLPFGGDGEPGVVFGLTAPRLGERWAGNLFRYGFRAPAGPLDPPSIVDRDGQPAIDGGSGLPLPGTRSLWSDAPDSDLLAGGAAGRLPAADARKLYADVASTRLLEPPNRLEPGNPQITRAALGLAPGDAESIDDVLSWLASLRTPGDPGLRAPVIVNDTASAAPIVFAATQDGFLHAFDADSGAEQWGWMPRELLPRLPGLMRDAPTAARSHGIDGPLLLHELDADGDGRIGAGEHRWLAFGLGRGGNRYYAIDIARVDDPRLLWTFALPDDGVLSLAEPVVTRLPIAGSGQSAGDWVVLLAGGYDPRFDAGGASGRGEGASLFVVDASDGRLLWSAGGADSDLPIAQLASLPSAPRALDLDGDGLLDRAYVLDITGSLWRMDFAPGAGPGVLASARRVATLGAGGQRFFATPDASVARIGGEDRLVIAAGSGWITRPRDTSIEDRMYVVFDGLAGDAGRELTDADLFDATDARDAVPPDAAGWFLRLDRHGAGEKLAGASATFDHAIRFQTYEPLPPDAASPCGPPRSVARLYTVDVRTALPRNTAAESEDDAPEEIAASGIPGELRFGFPGRWDETCAGCRPRPFGVAGSGTFDPGYAGDPVRTSWRKLVPPPASP